MGVKELRPDAGKWASEMESAPPQEAPGPVNLERSLDASVSLGLALSPCSSAFGQDVCRGTGHPAPLSVRPGLPTSFPFSHPRSRVCSADRLFIWQVKAGERRVSYPGQSPLGCASCKVSSQTQRVRETEASIMSPMALGKSPHLSERYHAFRVPHRAVAEPSGP